jgi:hypothetical protein
MLQATGGGTTMTNVADNEKVTLSGGTVLVDLGKKSRKQIKRLRKGTGKLVVDVQQCIQELQTAGTLSESAKPVILIVREKRPRLRLF